MKAEEGIGYVAISWTAPAVDESKDTTEADRRSAAEFYRYQVTTALTGDDNTPNFTGTAVRIPAADSPTSHTAPGLTAATYYFRVQAANTKGTGDWSAASAGATVTRVLAGGGWTYRLDISPSTITPGSATGAEVSLVATWTAHARDERKIVALSVKGGGGGGAEVESATPQLVGFGTGSGSVLGTTLRSFTFVEPEACDENIGAGRITCTIAITGGNTKLYVAAGASPGSSYQVSAALTGFSLTAVVNGFDTTGVTVSDADIKAASVMVHRPGQAPTSRPSRSISYGENGTGAVAFFSATSPEGDEVGVSLQGVDGGDFTIDGGVLRFKSGPDFERATDDDRDNEYNVTVRATDVRPAGAKGAAPTSKLAVVVKVTNVDEDGTATIDWRQPEVGTALTAGATDPDEIDGATTFEWSVPKVSRPTLTNDSHWQDPAAANNDATYTPTADDEGKYLRVKATYGDKEGGDKVAYVRSGFQVRAEVAGVANDAPVFDGDTDDRDIAEDADVGDAVGNPVVATDPNNLDGGKLTYTIDAASADADSFSIDKRTGQVRVAKALDHEDGATSGNGVYEITVVATDPSGAGYSPAGTDTILVTITATGVDEAPSVKGKDAATDPATSHEVDEDANLLDEADLGNAADAVRYLAVATDDGDVVSLSLAGDDAAAFELVDIDGTGVGVVYGLTFKDAPNFESPTDLNKDNAYRVQVVAKDDAGHNSKTDVTVTVTNLDEPGKVSLSSIQPGVGTALTATLKDPDGGETDIRWQWSSGPTRDGGFEDIEGATSASYTPTAGDPADDEDTGDIGNYLRVTVTYNDEQGPDDTSTTAVIENQRDVEAKSANAVREAPETNNAPEFPAASVEVEVKESVTGGGNVGDPVKATDADDDVLTYSLSGGADKDAFGIVPESGQITVGADTELDYETRTSYMVEVKAEDPFGRSDTVMVTITVTDVDEPPVQVIKFLLISGMAEVDYAESGTGPVETYMAQGRGGATITWSVAGTDAGDFTIEGGVLRFKSSPDYESSTDDGGDNKYDVTVKATDGTNDDMLKVVVTVTDVVENVAPEFAADTAYRRVAENTAAGENIGDTLTYMLGGADADSFSIDASTGQLMTKAELDYETKASYTVEVTVTDAEGESDTITVTINITDMGLDNAYDANENGVIDPDEVIKAVRDYFNGEITPQEVVAVVRLYFSQ